MKVSERHMRLFSNCTLHILLLGAVSKNKIQKNYTVENKSNTANKKILFIFSKSFLFVTSRNYLMRSKNQQENGIPRRVCYTCIIILCRLSHLRQTKSHGIQLLYNNNNLIGID